ncbi:hypothetical protein [Mucilaginibacter flavus]|uniref:hypothetical protein n=1 Tax=Mucilaginibacter flavus TaxID=931504 RepID=UPI0025B5CB54|nr:hypothetical protein [Mucilaginibacter flavus]MDN3581824.1 hypothetical protein [Mucilaginibacter flavus]
MKKIALVIISILALSCSKKNDVQPQPHTIKITASGTDAFSAVLSTLKTTDTNPVTADSKTVAKGSAYAYTGMFNEGDQLSLDLESDVTNSITYAIYDNDTIVAQASGKELTTHTMVTVGYDIP